MSGKESSTVVAFRALVLLACLILVPAAAIVGSACPDLIKSTLVDRLSSLVDAWRGSPSKAAGEPAAADRAAAAADPARRAAAPAWPGGRLPTASIGARGDNANERRLAGGPRDAAPPWPANESVNGANGRRASPAGYSEHAGNSADARARSEAPTRANLPSPDRFEAIERRLRQAGATYYLLETHGAGEYRFHCQVPGERGGRPRHFEVIDRDPLSAMTRIADDIESWRAARGH